MTKPPTVLRCDLCRIEVPDERVLVDHTNGKRHQALLTARERFESSQNASVFVSRIKPEHNEETLKGYFIRFGAIKNCFIDKEKHVYAIVEYEQSESAKKCLESTDEHQLTDGTRLKVKQRNQQEFKAKRMLISEQEFLNLNKEKEIEQHAMLLQTLNNQITIDEQAQAIVQQEKITDDILKCREEFFKELEMMFSKHFPGAKLALIGSMANGLATGFSDMDLVLILNDTYIEPQHVTSSNNSRESMNIDENSCSNDVEMHRTKFQRNASDESSTQSMSPPLPPTVCSADDLLQMSIPDRLDYIRRLLRSYAAHVCHVQRIAQARCPVLRFCHKQQKIFCELSINNHLAVANTELIRYFLIMEPKLSPLLYTVRSWLKQKDLLGRGHRFNTYTLFWMIVSSMQLNHQQLPSVQSLAESAVPQRRYGPWNCSVPSLETMVKLHSSNSIEHILQQFFSFYSTFSGSNHDLSPWTGRLESNASSSIPFSILDPFEHEHNLSSNISPANWLKFQEECTLANQILTEAARKRQHKSWGLSLILTRKSLPPMNFHPEKQQHRPSPSHSIEWISKATSEQELEQKIQYVFKDILLFEPVNPELIRKKRPAASPQSGEVTPNSLAEQFEDTLSAKRRRIDDDGHALTPVMDSDDEKLVSSKEKTFFQIIYRTWQDRRKIKRSIDHENNNMPIFEREQLISMKLKEEKDHRLKTPLYLSMETKLIASMDDAHQQKARIHLESQSNEEPQFFIDLSHFLALYLPKMLENQATN